VIDDPSTVATPELAIVAAGFDPSGEAAATEALSAAVGELRARAHAAVERHRPRRVAERLAALGDDDVVVRRRGCELEARFPRRSVRVASRLAELLDDDDALVVVAACEALGEIGDVSGIAALCRTARAHVDPRCREAAVAALGSLGAPEGLGAVLDALDDKPAVRRRATVALAGFEGPEVEAALRRSLEDRDWQVRQAAEALRLSPEGTVPE